MNNVTPRDMARHWEVERILTDHGVHSEATEKFRPRPRAKIDAIIADIQMIGLDEVSQ